MAAPSEPPARRSKPRQEEELLRYATTQGGAVRINEANDNISYSDVQKTVDAWETYRTAMRTYKMAVRQTVDQAGFPQTMSYPDLPAQPS